MGRKPINDRGAYFPQSQDTPAAETRRGDLDAYAAALIWK
jgi:hypothetical protein